MCLYYAEDGVVLCVFKDELKMRCRVDGLQTRKVRPNLLTAEVAVWVRSPGSGR